MGKRIVDFCVICLTLVACLFIGLFIYQSFIDKEFTVGVNNIDNQLAVDAEVIESDSSSSDIDRRVLFQVNYYSNNKGNGTKLRELSFNYFDDWTLSQNVYRSSGIQFLNDYYTVNNDLNYDDNITFSEYDVRMAWNYSNPDTMKRKIKSLESNFAKSDLYFYDWTADVSYQGKPNSSVATGLQVNHPYVIKIDGKPYAITLDKTYDYVVKNFWGSWTNTVNFTWYDIFQGCMTAVEGNSGGYGDFYIKGDFSKYFTIFGFNKETGKFDDDSVSDIIRTYAVIKFHYDENGASSAKDSLFDQLYADANYGITEVDYAGIKSVYTFTEKDFSCRYSDTVGGDLLSLKQDAQNFIELHPNSLIKFDIDFSSLENVIGFDFNAFAGVPINKLCLRSDSAKTLTFLDDSLSSSGVNLIYKSDLLTLRFVGDVSFEEVVL